MRLAWEPRDGERREWEFAPYDLLTDDAEAIEGVGGTVWEDFDEFVRLFRKGNRRALRAALWILRRRDGEPSLGFGDLNLTAREVKYDLIGETERAIYRQRLLDGEVSDPDVRDFYIDVLGEDPTAGDPKAEPSDLPSPTTD